MAKVLNIRSVPERLMRDIKTESFKKGMTLRDFVLDVLAKRVGLSGGISEPKPQTSTAKIERQVMPNVSNDPIPTVVAGDHRADTSDIPRAKSFTRADYEKYLEMTPSEQMQALREGKVPRLADRPFFGPKHADDCDCAKCQAK